MHFQQNLKNTEIGKINIFPIKCLEQLDIIQELFSDTANVLSPGYINNKTNIRQTDVVERLTTLHDNDKIECL